MLFVSRRIIYTRRPRDVTMYPFYTLGIELPKQFVYQTICILFYINALLSVCSRTIFLNLSVPVSV